MGAAVLPAVLPGGPKPDRLSLRFDVSCPHDGARLQLVATGAPGQWGTRSSVTCVRCHRTIIVAVTLLSTDAPEATS